jgi:hypothetical protein
MPALRPPGPAGRRHSGGGWGPGHGRAGGDVTVRACNKPAPFRVSRQGVGIDDADTINAARQIVRDQPPGRYDVDDIRAEPFPSGHTSRQWGRLIRRTGGRVDDEPWPWAGLRVGDVVHYENRGRS